MNPENLDRPGTEIKAEKSISEVGKEGREKVDAFIEGVQARLKKTFGGVVEGALTAAGYAIEGKRLAGIGQRWAEAQGERMKNIDLDEVGKNVAEAVTAHSKELLDGARAKVGEVRAKVGEIALDTWHGPGRAWEAMKAERTRKANEARLRILAEMIKGVDEQKAHYMEEVRERAGSNHELLARFEAAAGH